MLQEVINFEQKFELFSELWSPKIIASMNDYHLKLVRVKGDFTWHDHKETDEVFIVLEGTLRIDLEKDYKYINAGELFVVPRGIVHKPFAENECKILLIEPAGTINTGEAGGEQTAPNDVWI